MCSHSHPQRYQVQRSKRNVAIKQIIQLSLSNSRAAQIKREHTQKQQQQQVGKQCTYICTNQKGAHCKTITTMPKKAVHIRKNLKWAHWTTTTRQAVHTCLLRERFKIRANSKRARKQKQNARALIAGNKVLCIKCNLIIVWTNNYNLIRLNIALNKM